MFNILEFATSPHRTTLAILTIMFEKSRIIAKSVDSAGIIPPHDNSFKINLIKPHLCTGCRIDYLLFHNILAPI